MNKKLALMLLFTVLFLGNSCMAKGKSTTKQNPSNAEKLNIRHPAVAGRFYLASKTKLSEMVSGFLEQAPKEEVSELIALIVPHAGFVFSGQVAAYSYKQLKGKNFDTVILIGDSHRLRFKGVSVGNYSRYRTPLGDIEVDSKLANNIISADEMISFFPDAHRDEHSIEVQLPFLQTILDDFKIVPVIMGERSLEISNMLADVLIRYTKGRNVLFVASTDLSHFHTYDKAVEIDKRSISAMEKLNGSELFRGLQRKDYELCGGAATVTAILMAEKLGADNIKLLKYANSGDVPFGDKERVVGYAAMAITKKVNSIETFSPVNKEVQKILLRIAREAIEGYATTGAITEITPEEIAVLNEKRGVFVSVYKGGRLRGCIGTHTSDKPLYQQVAKTAIDAAFFDRRFPKLRQEEIKDIKIELSVYLSGLVKIDDISKYEVGRHGIILKHGRRGATFLPHVSSQQGWDRVETLRQLCRKAGLPPDTWKDKETEFYIYSTQVIGE